MGNTNNFEFNGRLKRIFLLMMGIGVLAVVAGLLINPQISGQRIWANFLVNTVFFLGIALLGLFFIATHTMAYGGWHVLIRRIPEAISTFIPVGVGLLLIVVLGAVMGRHHLYHWTDTFLVQDTVSVAELREYEAHLHHGDDHGDEHGDELHDEDHGGTGSLFSPRSADPANGNASPDRTMKNGMPVLAASLVSAQDEVNEVTSTLPEDEQIAVQGMVGTDVEGEGMDTVVENATDLVEDHDIVHLLIDGADHAEEHQTVLDEGWGLRSGGTDYSWYHGKVSHQSELHHGHQMHASEYASEAEGKLIANPHFDKLLAHKAPYLNKTFFSLRFIGYAIIWIGLFFLIRRASLAEDRDGGMVWYKRSKVYSAIYMVLFGITSSTMAWDFLMSIDSHWFSTLYGWYNAASLWIACLAATTLILIYLKNQGYLPQVNENHLHDLGKYMFGFSVFWTYLWFSQYMLIWYANLPEETFYYHMRNGDPVYRGLFFLNLGLNFFVPFFVLITRNAKRRVALMTAIAASLFLSHWLDIFLEVMPGTVGHAWGLGLLEAGMLLAFAGLFLMVVFSSLAKASLVPHKHPFYLESVQHHT